LLDESTIDLIIAIYSVITVIIFGIMYRRGGILFSWVLVIITMAIASILFYFRHFDASFRIIGNIFYFLASIILSYSVIQEYYEIFIETEKNSSNSMSVSKNLVIFIAFSLTLITLIQLSLCLFLIIVGGMLFRINLKKVSITHSFMLLSIITAFLTLIFSILSNENVDGAWEVAYVIKIIFHSALLATGLSAPIEDRLNKSEYKYRDAFNRAEFYKDLFAHDISNILQNIQSSIDLFSMYLEKPENLEELNKLITVTFDQVKRGANLVSNVRKLSEIEEIEISIKTIEIFELLNESIEYIKKTYEEKKLEIKIESYLEKVYANANELLLNVFENILSNAVKYNNNTNVEILIRISDFQLNSIDHIKLEFIDNGIGIPDDMKDKIFDRGFIKEKSVSGMGLGLSLVNTIINKYNGKIWVENKIKGDYSKGSNFIILIPEMK
jgi:signal transduction histidine kinase